MEVLGEIYLRIQSWKGVVLLLFFIALHSTLFAQSSLVTGYVYSQVGHEPLTGATILAQSTEYATISDSTGYFKLELPPGLYNLEIRFVGYKTYVQQEIQTSGVRPLYLEIILDSQPTELTGVVIESAGFHKTDETPLSIRSFSYAEAFRIPGATLDLSKVIQSYPGVLPRSSFGYNIVFRGGSPTENGYYLDGVKIPSITHFSVQGASGGPNGLVNLDFVKNVDIYTAAFPVSRGNALSGVMEITERDGRTDKFGARVTLGATDYGATIEGPMGKKSSYLFSARHSFSQYLLAAFNVPVLPTYTDIQFRQKIKFDSRNELAIIAIAASDKYELNTEAEESDALLYNIGYIPEGTQQQYTIGLNYKHYLPNSYYNVIISHTAFNNDADKFKDNTGLEADRLLKYRSSNRNEQIRVEQTIFISGGQIEYGVEANNADNNFDIYGFDVRPQAIDTVDTITSVNNWNLAAYINTSQRLINDRLVFSEGIRFDMNTYNNEMINPLAQFSPRIAISWRQNEHLSINASTGIYYQMPNEVVLAFADDPYQDNLKYIRSPQAALGIEYRNADNYRVSVEGFYKHYNNYPFLLLDSISYANAIGDYVIIGNQPASSESQGHAYGLEFYVQQKLKRNYWWMASYTYSVSEFKDKHGEYVASVWDSRHFISLSAGKSWKSGWQAGLRWRYSSGTPYTSYDTLASSKITNWDVANRGIFDYNTLNANRLSAFHVLDIRVDKSWTFKRWSMNVFLDIQNAYRSDIELLPYLTTVNDDNGEPLLVPGDPSRYQLQQINSDTGRMLTTFGIVADF